MAVPGQDSSVAFILGTDHQYQRRQDHSPDNEKMRVRFEKLVQELITTRTVDAIGEEAGDDRKVWEHLKAEEAATPEELKGLFAGVEIVDEPTETIARTAGRSAKCLYADIRPAGAETMSVQERDEAMALACAERFRNAKSILVIVGEAHREGVARILTGRYGWRTESCTFPSTF